MKRIRWTIQENQLLRDNYFDCELSELLHLLPKRTWNSIKIQARKLGLNRDNFIGRNSSLEVLLEENNQTYYWIGFLLADGHFSKENRIKFHLAKKDKERVFSLAEFLKTPVREETNGFSIHPMNKNICKSLKIKFDIHNNKTENPPKTIIQDTEEKTLSLLIGFIDGDGCIKKQTNRPDSVIQIKLHKNWEPILSEIEEFLFKYFDCKHNKKLTKINNSGYASLVLSNQKIVKGLKAFVIKNNLSVLERKWNIIDENLKQRRTLDDTLKLVYDELNKNPDADRKEICKSLNISQGYLSQLLK
jgi:hypothetical protein